MAIKARDIAAILVERIEATWPAPAHFDVDETDDWPPGVLPALLNQSLVTEAVRAESITCPGCELQCRKAVVIRQTANEKRAFVSCDEEPENGRIPVPLNRLQRFTTDLRALAILATKELKLSSPKVSKNRSAYALGVIKGRNGTRQVILGIEDGGLFLGVGHQREPLTNALSFGASGIEINVNLIRRLAHRKEISTQDGRHNAPDRARQKERKMTTQARNRAILRVAAKEHSRGGITWTRVASDIAQTQVAGGLSAPRIRRIIAEQLGIERKFLRSKLPQRK